METTNKNCLCCDSPYDLMTCNGNIICSDCYQSQLKAVDIYDINRTTTNPEINEVIQGKLYIGNYDFAKDKAKLIEKGITHILVCGLELKCLYKDDFIYKKIDIKDCIEQSIKSYFAPSIQFIDESNTCFVHCHGGVSRSAAIVIAYLMSNSTPPTPYKEALDYLKAKRPYVHPNHNFVQELIQYEKDNTIKYLINHT